MTLKELRSAREALQDYVSAEVARVESEFGCFVELARFEHLDVTNVNDKRRQYVTRVSFRFVLDEDPR